MAGCFFSSIFSTIQRARTVESQLHIISCTCTHRPLSAAAVSPADDDDDDDDDNVLGIKGNSPC